MPTAAAFHFAVLVGKMVFPQNDTLSAPAFAEPIGSAVLGIGKPYDFQEAVTVAGYVYYSAVDGSSFTGSFFHFPCASIL